MAKDNVLKMLEELVARVDDLEAQLAGLGDHMYEAGRYLLGIDEDEEEEDEEKED